MKATFGNVGVTGILVVLVIVAGVLGWRMWGGATTNEQPIARASYVCGDGAAVEAAYYAGKSAPAASASSDQPPVPGGKVVLLVDGAVGRMQTSVQTQTLAQTISADGGRYANADESVVFWDKGNGALFTRAGEQTPESCVQVAPDAGGLSNVYATSTGGFSIRYPVGYAVDDSYHYQELGPGKDIAGVKFTIAPAVAAGTNLSSDSYVSVEQLPGGSEQCTADRFLDGAAVAREVIDGDVTYSVASSTGAGAGNRYEETVYALPGITSCTAVRYFIHYGAFENYPPGTVKVFDRAALLAQFDTIRRTLKVAP